MASRVIHLTICNILTDITNVKQCDRFKVGHILPDAISTGQKNHADSHFKKDTSDKLRKYIDFSLFFTKYKDLIYSDDLYLGYYLHLIQDAVYRKFLYRDYGFDNYKEADFRETLHRDYVVSNSYLINKHKLVNDIHIPVNFENEPINQIYPFLLDDFVASMNSDFDVQSNFKATYLTEKLIDEFISISVELCIREISCIKDYTTSLNPYDYAWNRQ